MIWETLSPTVVDQKELELIFIENLATDGNKFDLPSVSCLVTVNSSGNFFT